MTDTESVSFRLIGSDTGIARLLADLELAGAHYPIIAEPEHDGSDPLNPRSFSGNLTGLTADQATAVTLTYLPTTSGHRAWINGQEVGTGL
jgi:hypothetical protein